MMCFLYMAAAQFDNAYYPSSDLWHDGDKQERWMGRLPDDFRLFDLSLYGTHNSAAVTHPLPFVTCQSVGLDRQMSLGIRLLDVRIRRVGESWALHHGPIWLGRYLDFVLKQIAAFLKANKSEIIFMSVSEDDDPSDVHGLDDKSLFEKYLDEHVRKEGIETYQQVPSSNSTLQTFRGKLVVIGHRSGYTFSKFQLGHCALNMKWDYTNIQDLYTKWEEVRSSITQAGTYSDMCIFTGLNLNNPPTLLHPKFAASGKGWPWFSFSLRLWTGVIEWFASRSYMPDFPRGYCVFGFCAVLYEGMNRMTTDYIRKNRCDYKRVGFIYGDYPGPDMVSAIHDINFCPRKSRDDIEIMTYYFVKRAGRVV